MKKSLGTGYIAITIVIMSISASVSCYAQAQTEKNKNTRIQEKSESPIIPIGATPEKATGHMRARKSRPGVNEDITKPADLSKIKIPAGVKFISDIIYREGNKAWNLDLAMPESPSPTPRPGIVFVHGGGWNSNDKRIKYCLQGALEYAQKGYVSITVNYRLTGEAPFPACVEDVKCAVRWFRAHAKEYNLDPNRIGGCGNSAGAHLVAMLGLVGPQAGLEGDGPYQEYSSLLQAACVIATPTYFLEWHNQISQGAVADLLAGKKETFEERAKKASPLSYVRADAPPFLVIHGSEDNMVDISQPTRFVKDLRATGVRDVAFMIFVGSGHDVLEQNYRETYPAIMSFFDHTIGKLAVKE